MSKMKSKFDMNTHGLIENVEGRAKNNLVYMVFDTNMTNTYESKSTYVDVDVTRITPRSINQYSQGRIDRLARSIHNTNDRLIHPIVVVRACDLPETHEVIKRFRERGVDPQTLDLIIVAGERRYRAWMLLREKAAADLAGRIGMVNPFDTITVNILTATEALNERAYYEDSNMEARQLTPLEGILHIRAALEEVQTNEQKREALIEMNGGSEDGVSDDADVAARKFNTANYCMYYLANELGIEGWSLSTVKAYLAVVNKCPTEVIDAVIAGKYKATQARETTDFTHEQQLELLRLWQERRREEYRVRLAKIRAAQKQESATVRYTYRDAKRQISGITSRLRKERTELKAIADKLGAEDKAVALKAVKEIDCFIKKIEHVSDQF